MQRMKLALTACLSLTTAALFGQPNPKPSVIGGEIVIDSSELVDAGEQPFDYCLWSLTG
jgi:hypothetical protein